MSSKTDGIEQREWECSECGEELIYPDTGVLEHYDQAHSDDYGYMIGWYDGSVTDQS